MVRNYVRCMGILLFALTLVMGGQAVAQEMRALVPESRTVALEVVNPQSGTPSNAFCLGTNSIDIRLTNNSGYGQYVSVINRDTRGQEKALFNGHLQPGEFYLSQLLGTQLALTGPAGTESVWIVSRNDANMQGQAASGWTSYYVQNCGGTGTGTGGPWIQQAQIWAQMYPNVLEQGQKGTIALQTGVGSQQNVTYYFEILNSWGQLWKRIPVNKMPFERYQVTLPVGAKTKPGVLTYTVNLLMESAYGGQQQKIGTARFSFRIVKAGSMPQPEPYNPWNQMYQGYPGSQIYPEGMMPMPYGTDPYSGLPGYGTYQQPYGSPSYSPYPYYGTSALGGPVGERQIQ